MTDCKPSIANTKMKTHELKIEQQYLEDLISGEKTFELRFNDRNYQKGDVVKFYKVEDSVKDCRFVEFNILSVFSGTPSFGLKDGWVILSISLLK